MEKTVFLTAVILIIFALILVVILSPGKLTSFVVSETETGLNNQNLHAWTKAICDKDNFCQDYTIECDGRTPTKISPITGATVQFDSLWQDPRNVEQRERLCD